ncbi:hypothetical protein GIB67_000629 [Kingdonia uniflora]|uniref:glycerophosphodiester phosphodiesterase n=1 Tax=Kingdonia uniflora TaxID=39325 RepID=A0A7J7ND04_9MAGN|nr:hypothetical protein GIB67_000629 [Kingdonia uniflora]
MASSSSLWLIPFLFLSLTERCFGRPFYPLPSKMIDGTRQPLQTFRPYNIAHRGSNGEIPEETAAAYMKAIEEGADFIETDILASKDGVLICFHDVTLDATTDIANHKKFVDRKRTYEVQGENVTGWFIVDFTLEELKSLRVNQRYKFRDQQYNACSLLWEEFLDRGESYFGLGVLDHWDLLRSPSLESPLVLCFDRWLSAIDREETLPPEDIILGRAAWQGQLGKNTLSRVLERGKFSIITFEEFISIALDAERVVGIYPEIKNPVLINQHVKWAGGKKFEDKFVETLKKYGYKGSYLSKDWLNQPVFIQSFAPTSLIYISSLTDLPKIFLIDDVTIPTQDTNQSYWEITSDSYFEFIKDYVVGIGPWKDTIVPVIDNYLMTSTDLVAKAHSHDLQVHPYTFRNENQYLHCDFHQDPYVEYDYWLNKIKVDGLFTDFTGSVHRFQDWTNPPLPKDDNNAATLLHKIGMMLSSYGKV